MNLIFIPTRRGGGVKIEGDDETLALIERLLTRHAMDSYACYEDGCCMALSRYFEKDRTHTVDWITLFVGIGVLRTSIGYNTTKQNHALVCCMEYELLRALSLFLKMDLETLDDDFEWSKGISDYMLEDDWYSRLVYLYKLKTATKRRRELLSIIDSLSPMFRGINKNYCKRFDGLSLRDLDYPAGTKFEFDL